MYRKNKPQQTTIARNTSYEGERIEQKINRIVNNKEPIRDGAPITYTERKEGVIPGYDIRTDRWELALDAMDKVNADKVAQRDKRQASKEKEIGKKAIEGMDKEAGRQSTDTTGQVN